ncbi:hypothetical protein QCM8_207 [Bacillus phage QCM8]|nr:hypothetical protein QCM8_207 [Bacillus phage QCM8]
MIKPKINLGARNFTEGVEYIPFKKVTTVTEDKSVFMVNKLVEEVMQEVDGKRIKKVRKIEKTSKGINVRIGGKSKYSTKSICSNSNPYIVRSDSWHDISVRIGGSGNSGSSRGSRSNDHVSCSGNLQNVQKETRSRCMEPRHTKRTRAGSNQRTECLPTLLPGEVTFRKLRLLKTSLIKYSKIAAIPLATVSTFFLGSLTDRAYAATTNSFFDGQGGSMFQTVTNFFTGQVQNAIPDPIQKIVNWFGEFTTLIENLPKQIGVLSADLMAWIYQLCSDLILKTPLWLFDNDWFFNMCHLFSAVALGAAAVLTIIEGIKRMLSGVKDGRKPFVSQPMEFSTIIKRWSMVAGFTAVVPYVFQKAFQFLNFLSEKISSLGGHTMKAAALSSSFSTIDVIALIAFDIVLISTVIPLLWQNGRRFFDLLTLGVVTPLALVAGYSIHTDIYLTNGGRI